MRPRFNPPPGTVVRVRQQRWRVASARHCDTCVLIDVEGIDAVNRGRRTAFLHPFDEAELVPAAAAPKQVTRRGWRRLARRVLGSAVGAPGELVSAASAQLQPMPFQLEPALALLQGRAARMLLADEVGLGKTIQAGLVVSEVLARDPDARALVVVPAGLREQWQEELQHRFGLEARAFDAAGLARATAELPFGLSPWEVARLAVTSIDFVKRPEVLRALESLVWDVMVFDEAHGLAGLSSRHRAAEALATRARFVVLVSATPHSGEPESFARLCALGDVGGRFPLAVFRRTRAMLGADRPRRVSWLRLSPSREEVALHGRLAEYVRALWRQGTPAARLTALVLLKRGASSPAAIARSINRRREFLGSPGPAATPPEQLTLALDADTEPDDELCAPALDAADWETEVLDELHARARDLAGAAGKVATLLRLLRRAREPALVFTEYRDTLEELAAALAPPGPPVIHGGMSPRDRQEAARRFTHGSSAVLLATDAASEGLNLHQRCRFVVSFDLPWTPLRVEQRAGRVDRIGQHLRVHASHLVTRGTYEEEVARRLRTRAVEAAAVLHAFAPRSEIETAAALMADVEPTPARLDVPAYAGSDPDVAELARREALRLVSAQALLGRAASVVPPGPFVRRHDHSRSGRFLVGYRACFVDEYGNHLCDTVFGLTVELVPRPDQPWQNQVLASPSLTTAAWKTAVMQLAGWSSGRAFAAAALRRDRAIAVVARTWKARLSARVLQPDLFSHRAERDLTPQLVVLDASLHRLHRASARLRSQARPKLESVAPVFAVSVR